MLLPALTAEQEIVRTKLIEVAQQPRDSAPAPTAAPIVATGQSSAEPATPLPAPTPPLATAMVATLPTPNTAGASQTPGSQSTLLPPAPPTAPAQAAPDTPTPAPTTQPPPTATQEPTPTSTPTPTPGPEAYFPANDPERPEIIGLHYTGYAGRGDGRFIVVFDEPVFVVRHPGSDPKVVLDVAYPSSGGDELELQTVTSLDQPSRTLEFGPVEEEFAVAIDVEVNNSEILLGVNGQAAILSVDLGGHPDEIFLNPDYADEVQDPALVRRASGASTEFRP